MASYLMGESQRLRMKSEETRLFSYLFRRLPLYFGGILCFFLLGLLLTLYKDIDLKLVNVWLYGLRSVIPHHCEWVGYLIVIALLNLVVRRDSNKVGEIPSRRRKNIEAVLATFSVQLLAVITMILSLSAEQPVIAGAATAGTVTIISLVVNRTLGFTRRYERYQFFSQRAMQLAIQYRSFKRIGTPFAEQHIREMVAFFEALAGSKHTATLGDSFYLLKQLEKRVAEL